MLGKNSDQLLLLGRQPSDGAPGLLPQVLDDAGVAEDQTRAGKDSVAAPFLLADWTRSPPGREIWK